MLEDGIKNGNMLTPGVAMIPNRLAPLLTKAAALTVTAHLEHMMEQGRVAREGARYRLISKAP